MILGIAVRASIGPGSMIPRFASAKLSGSSALTGIANGHQRRFLLRQLEIFLLIMRLPKAQAQSRPNIWVLLLSCWVAPIFGAGVPARA
jgi:hypothetical protein